jgi:hypothetical protein
VPVTEKEFVPVTESETEKKFVPTVTESATESEKESGEGIWDRV